MFSFTGIGAAAGAIILALAGLVGLFWMLGQEDIINYINGWVLLAGFVLLFVGALFLTYKSASAKSPEAPVAAGAKAVGLQILKILLIFAGIIGLIIVYVSVIGHW